MVAQTGQDSAAPTSETTGADVELAPELCAQIRALATALPDMDCYQILGIGRDATVDGVRAAFFERSRRFHPDRYSNKRLGPYQQLLHEIYKRVVAANEVLRDPELRASYDRSLPREAAQAAPALLALPGIETAAPPRPAAEAKPAETPAAKPAPAPPKPTSSLRDRRGLRAPNVGLDGLARQLEANREKGVKRFREAEACAARGDWAGAVQGARMALAFAPRDQRFHSGLAEWLPRVLESRSRDLLSRAESLLARGEHDEALTALVDAFRVLPTDAGLARRAAGLAFARGGRLDVALELAECAVALEEDDLAGRKLLGLVCLAVGRRDDARMHLQRVWKVDPRDAEVRKALASI